MKNEPHLRARVKQLEAKADLTPDEKTELDELLENERSDGGQDDTDEVAVTVRFPSRVWEQGSVRARDERMSKNAAVVRAYEQWANGKSDVGAQEIAGLAQALTALDEDVCSAERAATRKAYGRALARNYGVRVEELDSKVVSKNETENEDDAESNEGLRQQYRLYEQGLKELHWLKQHSRKFRSFTQFRDASPAERRAEFKRLEIAEPWAPRSSRAKKAGAAR